jgi:ribosomal-protein-alanine acetyltransferase
MEIKVENASIRLVDRLYEIEKQCFVQEAFTKQQIIYLLGDCNSIALVARLHGEVVGFAIARVDIHRNTAHGHIITVDVAPAYRGKGIARKLLSEIEIMLRAKGVPECCLEVREGNVAALRLYQRLGYVKVSKLKMYYGNINGLYLKKTL